MLKKPLLLALILLLAVLAVVYFRSRGELIEVPYNLTCGISYTSETTIVSSVLGRSATFRILVRRLVLEELADSYLVNITVTGIFRGESRTQWAIVEVSKVNGSVISVREGNESVKEALSGIYDIRRSIPHELRLGKKWSSPVNTTIGESARMEGTVTYKPIEVVVCETDAGTFRAVNISVELDLEVIATVGGRAARLPLEGVGFICVDLDLGLPVLTKLSLESTTQGFPVKYRIETRLVEIKVHA